MIVLLVIAILVVLIITHELGHFIAAKLSGVTVQEFGVGYPPRAFLFGAWGGTEYTLNWLPFGGFVRLYGDEGEDRHGRGSFTDASRGRQAVILIAGVAMNLLLAWALFAVALHMGIPQAVSMPGPGVALIVSDVVPGSPADAARLKPGDQLLGVMDQAGAAPSELTPSSIANFVDARGGQTVLISYLRDGATTSAAVIPADAVIPGQAGRAAIGVGLVFVSSQPLAWHEAIAAAFPEMWNSFVRVAESVLSMIGQALTGSLDLSGVVGPVGLVSVVNDAAATGAAQVLALAGFVSVNLAVINLIPIPALDGGRLAIVGIEAAMRKPAPKLAIHLLNLVGLALIIVLMVVVTYHDIAHLVA